MRRNTGKTVETEKRFNKGDEERSIKGRNDPFSLDS